MAFIECVEVGEWIEEEVARPIEEWETQFEEECRQQDCIWWMLCLNVLFCWVVVVVVRVVRWVIETVLKWVVQTVCTVILTITTMVVAIVVGIGNVVWGIATGNWAQVVDGFIMIAAAVVEGVLGLARAASGGTIFNFAREDRDRARLRRYVRGLLEARFAGDPVALEAAIEAIGVDRGAFGLRLSATARNTFVDAETVLEGDTVPVLIRMHEDPNLNIDIRQLAGYQWDEFFQRGRPQVVGGGRGEVESYIMNRGGEAFRIYPMSTRVMRDKATVASERARGLGLMMRFTFDEVEVTAAAAVSLGGSTATQDQFNTAVLDRTDETVDAPAARAEQCRPIGGAVFAIPGFNGFSAHLDDAVCLDGDTFVGSNTSGVSFRDRLPDIVFRYVFVHELGHYFGLCHVDGADHIMYTVRRDWWSWRLLPEYLYFRGTPSFTLDEARRAWDYIIGDPATAGVSSGFPTDCLTTRAF